LRSQSLECLKSRLLGDGFDIHELDGSAIHDPRSFYEAAVRDLPMGVASPLDADWRVPCNWNAFSDFLWQGLTSRGHRRVAILWLEAGTLMKDRPALAQEAVQALTDVVRGVRAAGPAADA